MRLAPSIALLLAVLALGAARPAAAQAEAADTLRVEFADGVLDTGGRGEKPGGAPRPKTGRKDTPPEQGSLF